MSPRGAIVSWTLLAEGERVMTEGDVIVFVVDDDAPLRESLTNLLRSMGFRVAAFASAQEFLRSPRPDVPSCLVLDVQLPELSGLELQQRLAEADLAMPIIFITGHGDIPMAVQAMKAGAVEFFTKPFRDQALLDAVRRALLRDSEFRKHRSEVLELRERLGTLTARERQVLALVVAGLLNKQIAGELGTSELTIKAHRGRVMRKMQAASLADLVRMAEKLGISPA
jgi:FixJ family two-component response regulator